MPERTVAKTESRIAFDETDWATRVGLLQIAEREGVFTWSSNDGQYHYMLTAARDPDEGIGYIDTNGNHSFVPDPEHLSPDFRVINPGPWLISRVVSMELDAARASKSRQVVSSTGYCIDEHNRTLNVIETHGPTIMNDRYEVVSKGMTAGPAKFKDIAELADALDDLGTFLSR